MAFAPWCRELKCASANRRRMVLCWLLSGSSGASGGALQGDKVKAPLTRWFLFFFCPLPFHDSSWASPSRYLLAHCVTLCFVFFSLASALEGKKDCLGRPSPLTHSAHLPGAPDLSGLSPVWRSSPLARVMVSGHSHAGTSTRKNSPKQNVAPPADNHRSPSALGFASWQVARPQGPYRPPRGRGSGSDRETEAWTGLRSLLCYPLTC